METFCPRRIEDQTGQRLSVAAVILATALLWVCFGCGDDKGVHRPPKNGDAYLPQTSPENVLHNLAMSYTKLDYKNVVPLFREDYIFFFAKEDTGAPGVPPQGIWGFADELQATWNMFDRDYSPEPSHYKVKTIEMVLALVSSLQETNLELAPYGTLNGRVALDMVVTLDDGHSKLLVRSRPLFYFAPDEAGTASIWRLWRCKDAPFDDELLDLGRSGFSFHDPDGSGVAIDESVRRTAPAAEMATPEFSWGALKATYR